MKPSKHISVRPPSMSVSIMAHPSRKEWVSYLHEKLGDVPVSWDEGDGIWENRKRATMMFDPNASHHLVVQDDALICKDFYERAQAEIEKRPDWAFSFYLGNRKQRPSIAAQAMRSLPQGGVEMPRITTWGLAIVLPTKIIGPGMWRYCENLKTDSKHDDTRVAKWVKHKRVRLWYPLPCLVEHREGESLVGNSHGRSAVAFVGE